MRNHAALAVVIGILSAFSLLVALGWAFGAVSPDDVPVLVACFVTISAGCVPLLASNSKPCPRTTTTPAQ